MSEDIGGEDINKYDAWVSGHDVIFQFTIHAQYVKDAFIIFHGYNVPVIPKQICGEKWAICLKFPGIAIGAFCFSMYVYLHLPGAINIRSVISLSKRFIPKDRKLIENKILQSARKISFDLTSALPMGPRVVSIGRDVGSASQSPDDVVDNFVAKRHSLSGEKTLNDRTYTIFDSR
jgi:hypothetical protein